MQWTSWSFRIGDKAFTGIRPLSMRLLRETAAERSRFWLIFYTTKTVFTGRWLIALEYDRGPMTKALRKNVAFDSEAEARKWFDHILERVFLKTANPTPPPQPTKKIKKKSHLKLL